MKNLAKILVGGAGTLMLAGLLSAQDIKNETFRKLAEYITDLSVGVTFTLGAGYKIYSNSVAESNSDLKGFQFRGYFS